MIKKILWYFPGVMAVSLIISPLILLVEEYITDENIHQDISWIISYILENPLHSLVIGIVATPAVIFIVFLFICLIVELLTTGWWTND